MVTKPESSASHSNPINGRRPLAWVADGSYLRQNMIASDVDSDDEEIGCRHLEMLGELGEFHRLALA